MDKNNSIVPSQKLHESDLSEIGYGDLEYFGNLVFSTIMPKLAAVHRVHLFQQGTKPPANIAGLKIAVNFEDTPQEIASEIVRLMGSFASGANETTEKLAAKFKSDKQFRGVVRDIGRNIGEIFISNRYSALSKFVAMRRGIKYRTRDEAERAEKEAVGRKYSKEEFQKIWDSQAISISPVVVKEEDHGLLDAKVNLWHSAMNLQKGYRNFNESYCDDLYNAYLKIVEDSGGESGDGDGESDGEGNSSSSSGGKKGGKGEKGNPGKQDKNPGKDGDEGGEGDEKKDGEGDEKKDGEGENESPSQPEKQDGDSGDEGESGISFTNGDDTGNSPPDTAGYANYYSWRKVDAKPMPPKNQAQRIAAALRPRFTVRRSKMSVVGGHYADRRKLAEFQFPYRQDIVAQGGQSKLSLWIFLDGSSSMGSYADSLFDLSNTAAQAIAIAMKNGDPDAEVRFCVFDGNLHYTEGNSTDLLFARYNPQGGTTFLWLAEISENYKGEIVVITDGEGNTPDLDDFSDKTAKNRIHFIRIGSDYSRGTRIQLEKIAKSVIYCRDLGELPAIMATSIRPANV